MGRPRGREECFMFDAESSAFRLNRISETRVLGEVEKKGFIALPGRGTTRCSCPQTCVSQLEEDSEKLIVIVQPGQDQLLDVLLGVR